MKLGLRIGDRANAKKFIEVFTPNYLDSLNFHVSLVEMFDVVVLTKHGLKVVHDQEKEMITYCGDGIWDVRED